jgi:hypothetical protein
VDDVEVARRGPRGEEGIVETGWTHVNYWSQHIRISCVTEEPGTGFLALHLAMSE